jgi:hypothetical protein
VAAEAPDPVPPATPTPPAEEPSAAPQKLSAADEPSISKEQVTGTLSEVQQMLKEIAAHPQTAANKAAVTRIRSFVRLSEQSLARNDLRQGNILAHRALALARDLAGPK